MQIIDKFYVLTTSIIFLGLSILIYMYAQSLRQKNRESDPLGLPRHNFGIQNIIIFTGLPDHQT